MVALSPDYIVSELVERGLPQHIATGFALNFQDESGLNPGINEANPIVEGSRGGFGLAQWTGPRRRALESYAAQRGANIADPELQLDFLMTELQGPESGAWQKIQAAGTPGEAGAAIVNAFLRPAESHRRRREAEYLGGAVDLPSGGSAPSNALSSAPMQHVDPVALIEAAQQRSQQGQFGQPTPDAPLYDFAMPQNALAPVQFDQTRYNTRRLMQG